MLKFIYDGLFSHSGTTSYRKYSGGYMVEYCKIDGTIEGNVVVSYKGKEKFSIELLGGIVKKMKSNGYEYHFCENKMLTSLVGNGLELSYPNGTYLNGNVRGVEYVDGYISSCELDGKIYRKINGSELYIVYSESICAWYSGVYMNILIDEGKYWIIANGRPVCWISSLDVEAIVHWTRDHEAILRSCYGYNTCDRRNLMVQDYFYDMYWIILHDVGINSLEYNRKLVVEYGKSPKYYLTKDFYLLYDEHGGIELMIGYQPHAKIIRKNIHGLLNLKSEYYYNEGLLQWIRNGGEYMVRYNDHTWIRMRIYSDLCIGPDGKKYYFKNHYTAIPMGDEIMDVFYDNGIPKMLTHGTIRNIVPNLHS